MPTALIREKGSAESIQVGNWLVRTKCCSAPNNIIDRSIIQPLGINEESRSEVLFQCRLNGNVGQHGISIGGTNENLIVAIEICGNISTHNVCRVATSFRKDVHTKRKSNAIDCSVQDALAFYTVGLPRFGKTQVDLVHGEWLIAVDHIGKDVAGSVSLEIILGVSFRYIRNHCIRRGGPAVGRR